MYTSKLVGSPTERGKDLHLVIGRHQYIDNLKFPNMVFTCFVRGPYVHTRIKRINLSKIEENNDVAAILIPDKVKKNSDPVPTLWPVPFSKIHEHYALVQGRSIMWKILLLQLQ